MNDKDDFDDGRVVFYYSRERRLKRASPSVRKFNEAAPPRKSNLFRTLTATRPLQFMFISVVTVCVAVIIASLFITSENTRVLENNTVVVSVATAGDKSYITVKKTAKAAGAYSGAVDIAVSFKGENQPIDARRVYFTPETEEVFRFSVPFTGKKMLLLFEAGAGRALFTISL
ncbi:MAG: hypothetical protein LBB72_06285 [Spirochaetaceae bacterium]|jgi:hypothetical protein|nr:hypothetical protein [Spirochaetaceae bacterium]